VLQKDVPTVKTVKIHKGNYHVLKISGLAFECSVGNVRSSSSISISNS